MGNFADQLGLSDPAPAGASPFSSGIEIAGTLDEFFPPDVDCGFEPFGTRVVVQVRGIRTKTKGGIIIVQDTKETEAWNTQVARLVKIGPLAFKKRDSAEPWPEGIWAQPGEYVRIPRWGGDRWSVKHGPDNVEVVFLLLNDHELMGKITINPLDVRAYVL